MLWSSHVISFPSSEIVPVAAPNVIILPDTVTGVPSNERTPLSFVKVTSAPVVLSVQGVYPSPAAGMRVFGSKSQLNPPTLFVQMAGYGRVSQLSVPSEHSSISTRHMVDFPSILLTSHVISRKSADIVPTYGLTGSFGFASVIVRPVIVPWTGLSGR